MFPGKNGKLMEGTFLQRLVERDGGVVVVVVGGGKGGQGRFKVPLNLRSVGQTVASI